jgi:hypothetical protein
MSLLNARPRPAGGDYAALPFAGYDCGDLNLIPAVETTDKHRYTPMNPSNSLTIYGLRIRIGIAPTLTGTPPEGDVLNPHNMNFISVYRCSSVVELPFLG